MTTPRFELNTFSPGETDWDHTDAVETLDETAIARGPISERPSNGEYDDEFYYAIDQRTLWRWDAGSSDWKAAAGLGTASEPVPGTSHFKSVAADSIDVGNDGRPDFPNTQQSVGGSFSSTSNTGFADVGDQVGLFPPIDTFIKGDMNISVRFTARLRIRDASETVTARLEHFVSGVAATPLPSTEITQTGSTSSVFADSDWQDLSGPVNDTDKPFRINTQLKSSDSNTIADIALAMIHIGVRPA